MLPTFYLGPYPEMGIVYEGHNINKTFEVSNIHSWKDCNKECMMNETCAYWSWFQGGAKCELKTSDEGRKSQSGVISGERGCIEGIVPMCLDVLSTYMS